MRRTLPVRGPLAMFLVVALVATSCSSSGGAKAKAGLSATTTTVEVTYSRSCEKTAQSQAAMDSCAASELKELQGQLTTALAAEKRFVAPSLVDEAQASFARYETAECEAVASRNQGGSIYPLVVGTCEVGLTVQRIQQVRSDTINAQQGLDRNP